ncbi:sensor histidine kinase [Paenibacillus harenae]|uniref:histidine kinase n=1 Tax=Paenibacillus harenae TaxID=306543 RepID=A0ABT9U160_PAEHA|nr:sensor histidine kinase [Paenibacillus harenae]MDQ0061738.1 signal transduction histidine kinase [Paenibacillus harenae]MDQ0113362.1 signal transduction histidine kinase [Paenibacillus harenae]
MRFWRFIQYERSYLILCAVIFVLTVAVYATNPQTAWQWQTFLYAFALAAIALTAFMFRRYAKNTQAIRRMNDDEAEPLSLEAEAYREALEQAGMAHIRALNEVQAKQKENYDFIVSWFHEIKTPIAILRLMQQTDIDPRSLEEELTRIEHYAEQAMYYAKLDSFNQDYELVNCNLELLVKEVVKAHSKSFISRKIKIRLDIPLTVVQTDSKWLLFIVNQLVTNSLKYTDEHGEITITARIAEQEKLLIIRDNGIGIEAKDLPRVFNRGFTGSNGRTHAKSTGMGLYLAQELSKKLGHFITCESVPGRFTEFVIHFPKNNDPYLSMLQNGNAAKTQ